MFGIPEPTARTTLLLVNATHFCRLCAACEGQNRVMCKAARHWEEFIRQLGTECRMYATIFVTKQMFSISMVFVRQLYTRNRYALAFKPSALRGTPPPEDLCRSQDCSTVLCSTRSWAHKTNRLALRDTYISSVPPARRRPRKQLLSTGDFEIGYTGAGTLRRTVALRVLQL